MGHRASRSVGSRWTLVVNMGQLYLEAAFKSSRLGVWRKSKAQKHMGFVQGQLETRREFSSESEEIGQPPAAVVLMYTMQYTEGAKCSYRRSVIIGAIIESPPVRPVRELDFRGSGATCDSSTSEVTG